jgi:hypothetical protein
MTTVIKEYENSTTGIKFVFAALPAQKKFAVRRLHKEACEGFSVAFGIKDTYVDDEEKILDDFFEADKLYDEWLSNY